MEKFSNKTIEELGFYVYALIDPRDSKIFYIGKGCGNRIFQHCKAAIKEKNESLKLNRIRDIIKSGAQVNHYILRHKLTEEEAFQIESALIDFLTYPQFNTEQTLTNIASGHHQWDEGIKTVFEISSLYDCEKIDIDNNDKGKLLLVSLNKSYDNARAKGVYKRPDIYEKTRKYWPIAKQKAGEISHVLGVYHGIVRAVLKVKNVAFVDYDDEKNVKFRKARCCFNGFLEENSPYLNKDVSDYPFGSGGSVRYI